MKPNITVLRALPILFCIQLPLCLFLTLPEQNVLDKTGNPPARPLVAFSLRQLSSAYTGNAIQVKRSCDNAIQDISFTAAGDFDTVALKGNLYSADCVGIGKIIKQ